MMVNSKAWFGGLTQTPFKDCRSETVGCGVGVLLCYKIQTLLELSNTHCIHTQTLTRTSFWGGQIWIWRMGTIGDNLQKFKKFLKNCHKMFRGMVEPDKSLISTLAFLSSCSCQFRHPCQFCCFWKFRQSLQFLFTFKNFKTFSNFKNVKKLDTFENFYAVDIFDNALVSQNIKFRHPCQFCHFWKFRQFFHFKKCWHF